MNSDEYNQYYWKPGDKTATEIAMDAQRAEVERQADYYRTKYFEEKQRHMAEALKPMKIKCQECGKEIGIRNPGKEIEWVDHDVSHNVYCPDCWNLKKLKE